MRVRTVTPRLKAVLACLLAAALAAGVAACGDDEKEGGPAPAPPRGVAISAAEAYAAARGTRLKAGTQFLRSTRDPEWALVSGSSAGRGIWAVWLRVDGGRWRPQHALLDAGDDSTPAEVPCDIKPPFSEPECPAQ